MEYTQKVSVVTLVMSNGSERVDEFEGVRYIKVDEGGHLILSNADRMTVGAYAPSEWKRVKRQTKD